MRIIAGKDAGRNIFYPKGRHTRPTQDRVKEAVFSIIQPTIQGSVCLDLFAASGGIGMEFLSRGAKFCYFCEKDNLNFTNLKKNIKLLDNYDSSFAFKGDFRTFLKKIPKKREIDIIYMDPPYDFGLEYEALDLIRDLDILSDRGYIVLEATKKMEDKEGFKLIDVREYGGTFINFIKRSNK